MTRPGRGGREDLPLVIPQRRSVLELQLRRWSCTPSLGLDNPQQSRNELATVAASRVRVQFRVGASRAVRVVDLSLVQWPAFVLSHLRAGRRSAEVDVQPGGGFSCLLGLVGW